MKSLRITIKEKETGKLNHSAKYFTASSPSDASFIKQACGEVMDLRDTSTSGEFSYSELEKENTSSEAIPLQKFLATSFSPDLNNTVIC